MSGEVVSVVFDEITRWGFVSYSFVIVIVLSNHRKQNIKFILLDMLTRYARGVLGDITGITL